ADPFEVGVRRRQLARRDELGARRDGEEGEEQEGRQTTDGGPRVATGPWSAVRRPWSLKPAHRSTRMGSKAGSGGWPGGTVPGAAAGVGAAPGAVPAGDRKSTR